MFKKNWSKVKMPTLRDARLAVSDHKEYWDMRQRAGDIFLDADMDPTMECIDEIIFQLDKLEKLGYTSDPEGVEEIMRQRWKESRSRKAVYSERTSMAPSVTGRPPTPIF